MQERFSLCENNAMPVIFIPFNQLVSDGRSSNYIVKLFFVSRTTVRFL